MASLIQFLTDSIAGNIFLYALAGGILPALLWLWFWLHEDNKHPEPISAIVLTFILGMLAVIAVYPLERFVLDFLPENNFGTLMIWAGIEEIFKFLAAYTIAFRLKIFDEPIDAFVYLITAALGFSAMENTFFLIKPLHDGNLISSLFTGNIRFMGASLLHVLSSGSTAVFVGFTFYKTRLTKDMWVFIGLTAGIILHTLFNYFIIDSDGKGLFLVFSGVWMTLIILIVLLEKVKRVKEF